MKINFNGSNGRVNIVINDDGMEYIGIITIMNNKTIEFHSFVQELKGLWANCMSKDFINITYDVYFYFKNIPYAMGISLKRDEFIVKKIIGTSDEYTEMARVSISGYLGRGNEPLIV